MRKRKIRKSALVTLLAFIWSVLIPIVHVAPVFAQTDTSTEIKNIRTERIELPNHRTANSKRFLNPDGTNTEEIYLGTIHYRKGNKWEDIDNTLIPSSNPEYKYKNKANRYDVEFAENTNGNRFMRFSQGDRSVEIRPIGLLTNAGQVSKNKIIYSKGQGENGLPVNLEYNVGYDSVKEDIILDKYQKINKLTFQLNLNNVTFRMENDGSIGFYDKDTDNKLWFMNRPYMVDSGEGHSDKVAMSIREVGSNLFLDIVPDDNWLRDPARAYPVRIDPSLTIQPDPYAGRDTFISQNYPESNYAAYNYLTTGYDSSGGLGVTRALLWFRLPALPSGSWIQSSTLSLYQYGSYSTTPTVGVHKITQDWSSGTVKWSNQPTIYTSPETSLTQNVTGWWNFDISNLVKGWYTSGVSNYGVELKFANEGIQRRLFRSSDYTVDTSQRPKLVINYDVNPLGGESFWTYAGNVHIANGNMAISETDVNLPGRIPITLSRTYNSRSTNPGGVFGYGWNSELDTEIKPVAKGPIQYIDSDRSVHYFEQLSDGTYKSPAGLDLAIVKNGDSTYTVSSKSGLLLNFNSDGKIKNFTDAQGNVLQYNRDGSNKVTSIEDPSGRTVSILYDANNRVSTVTDYKGRQTTYGYSGTGDLTRVTRAAGTSEEMTTYFEYDSNHNLTTVIDPKGYKTYYYYTSDPNYEFDDRVQSINPINKIINASFEVDSDGNTLPDKWTYFGGQQGTASYDTTCQPIYGSAGMKISANSANTYNYTVYVSESIPVDATETYTLSGNIKASQTSGSQTTIFSVIAFNSSGGNLGEVAASRKSVSGAFSWSKEKITFAGSSLPAGTSTVKVKVAATNGTGSGISWFDIVQLEEGGTDTDFISPTTYTVDRSLMLSAFYDGNGRKTLYTYDENNCTKKVQVDPNNFNYTTDITWNDPNNQYIKNKIQKVTDANANAFVTGTSVTNTFNNTSGNLENSQANDGTASKINSSFTQYSNNDLATAKDGNSNNTTGYETVKYYYDGERNLASSINAVNITGSALYDTQGNVISATSPAGISENLIVNSSFEEGTNWPDSWANPSNPAVTWGTTAYIGQRGLTFTNVSSVVTVGSWVQPTVADNVYYALSGYVKATTEQAAKSAYLKIDAYNSSNQLIGQVASNRIGEVDKWNRLQAVVSKNNLPAGTASIKAVIVVLSNTGTIHFDNIQLEKSSSMSPYNMAENSSFERGSSAPDNWENTTGISFGWESTVAFNGTKSIKIVNPSNWAGYAPNYYIPYDPNKEYSFSGFIKAAGLSNPAGAYVKINFYKSDFTQPTPSAQESNKLTMGTTEWTRLEARVLKNGAPAGTAYIKPVITAYNFTGTAYFDAVRLQEGSVTSFLEYNQPDGNGKGAGNYVTRVTNPLGYSVSLSYETAAGNLLTATDAKGNTLTYQYDNLDRLKSVEAPQGIDLKTVPTYDANGNITQVKNKNKAETITYNTTSYGYNNLDLLTSITDPLNYMTTIRYDADGNISEIEYPNYSDTGSHNKISLVYNRANRLSSMSFNGSTKYSFIYDPNGNVTKVTDDSTGRFWNYEFDTADRLKKVISTDGTKITTQENTFDKNSNRLTQKVTIGSNIYNTTFGYDTANQNLEVTDHNLNKSRLAYDEKGFLSQIISGNEAAAANQFNSVGQLIKRINAKADGSILSSFSYTYDPNGSRDSVTDNAGKTISYTYDSLNQLLSETDPLSNNTFHYSYDSLGNRTTKTVKDQSGNVISTTNYGYDAVNLRLTSAGAQTYTYDENGNLKDDGSKLYKWDAGGRLTEVRQKSDNSLIAQYEYDAGGRRVKSIVGTTVTYFHYDGNSIRVLYETDGNNNPTMFYTYSANGLLLSLTKVGQGTYYYHYNAHGDVVQLTNQNGDVEASYTYDAWGNILSKTGTMADANPYRYAGYRFDTETGMYYLIARYYRADLGRFISVDPVPGYNPYAYCNNNPINFIDPLGTDAIFISQTDALTRNPFTDRVRGINDSTPVMVYENGQYKTKPQGTGKNIVTTTKGSGVNSNTTKKPLTARDLIPDAAGLRLDQSTALVGGYSTGGDIVVSRNGINGYSYIEGNAGPQALVDLSSQVVVAWNINNPDDYAGPYYSGNISLEWFGGINVSAAISKYPTSSGYRSFLISVGPSLGFGGGGSIGRGNTYRAW